MIDNIHKRHLKLMSQNIGEMRVFDLFDKFIHTFTDEIETGDYWYDVGVLHANALIEQFNHDDWLELISTFSTQSDNWIARFCESIDCTIDLNVIPLLVNTLKRNNKALSIIILDTIRTLPLSEVDCPYVTPNLFTEVDKLIQTADSVELMMLTSLKKTLLTLSKDNPVL